MSGKTPISKNPIVMTIAGSDSGGGAGIAADLKTFAAFGVHGTCAITSITAQNTTGILGTFELSQEVVGSQIEAVCTDMEVKWVKTGMLASLEIVSEVASKIKKHKLSPVVDPVMAAEAGGTLLRKEALSPLIEELLPLCRVTTPNAAEAGILAGIPVKTPEDAKIAALKIVDLGVEAVVVTGGHLDATDLLYEADTGTFTRIPGNFVKGGNHGSGCTYSAAMTACLALGEDMKTAAFKAKKFVEQAILRSRPNTGKGVSPVNPLGQILEEKERYLILQNTKKAVSILVASPDFAKLVPKEGCNIKMILSRNESSEDIITAEGRIAKHNNRPFQAGCVDFGASKYAETLTSPIRLNSGIRATINIKSSKKILAVCREMGLSILPFDLGKGSENSSTIDRSAIKAIQACGNIPEMIYEEGRDGKSRIHLTGTSATELAKIAVEIAKQVALQ